MVDFDRESWIYIALIAIALLYFLWNSRRAQKDRKTRKNRDFRRRFLERKRERYNEAPLPKDGSRIPRPLRDDKDENLAEDPDRENRRSGTDTNF